jgi:hypothetical protein
MKTIISIFIIVFLAAYINDPSSLTGWIKAAEKSSEVASKVVKETGDIAAKQINQ